ncbi:MAG: type II secretion system protein GspD [Planctomycetota bacterium]|jgi:type IV pilus assembly protein PilQ
MCESKTKTSKKLFVWCIVFLAITVTATADVGTSAVEPAESSAAAADVEAIQTLTFQKDILIQDALRVLGQRYQKNIVPSPKITGTLAFTRLFEVTFDEAISAILGANFKYESEGRLIRVYTREEYKLIKADEDRKEYKVFTLFYLTADEAASLIKPVLSGSAVIQASTAAIADISGGLSGSGGGNNLAVHDTIVVYDFPEKLASAEEVIEAIDIRPKQVLIEATILSAVLTEGMDLGVDLNFMAGFALDGTASAVTTQETVVGGSTIDSAATTPIQDIRTAGRSGTPIETSGFANPGSSGLRIGVGGSEFRMFITALEQVTDTTILANPKIMTVNKQEGSVLIGQELGYRSSTTIGSGGVATEGEVKFLQTGTQLIFRPYIGDDGYIRMDIYPKDSSASLNVDGVPTETTTQLRTNIVVKDGETIVLGGLFRDVVTSSRNQVPILGDLPLIGALFRSSSDSNRREEVIIMITPHIIDSADQTDGLAREADIARKRHGARQGLQGIGRGRLAEDHYINAVSYYTNGDNGSAMSSLNCALDLRPSYFEALRLKERIVGEVSPQELNNVERIMLGAIEREDAAKWQRR